MGETRRRGDPVRVVFRPQDRQLARLGGLRHCSFAALRLLFLAARLEIRIGALGADARILAACFEARVRRLREQRLGARRAAGIAHSMPAPHPEDRRPEEQGDEPDRGVGQRLAIAACEVLKIRPSAVEARAAGAFERRFLVDEDAHRSSVGSIGTGQRTQPDASAVVVLEEHAHESQTFHGASLQTWLPRIVLGTGP